MLEAQDRRCAQCKRPLPAGSTDRRTYCSVACRGRAYDLRNRWDDRQTPGVPILPNPLHWHVGDDRRLLAGDVRDGYWRGPDGCPPGCPGINPPYTASVAVPVGREGLLPRL